MISENGLKLENLQTNSRSHFDDKKVSEVVPQKTTKRFKALVVEDDQSQWPLWENILSSLNKDMDIDWLTTAEEAQNYLRQAFQSDRPYDLVISDVYLEGAATGIDLWNRYGEATENFIFVSGVRLAKKEVLKKVEFGEPLFLEKPISAERCKRILKLLCDEDSLKGGHYE